MTRIGCKTKSFRVTWIKICSGYYFPSFFYRISQHVVVLTGALTAITYFFNYNYFLLSWCKGQSNTVNVINSIFVSFLVQLQNPDVLLRNHKFLLMSRTKTKRKRNKFFIWVHSALLSIINLLFIDRPQIQIYIFLSDSAESVRLQLPHFTKFIIFIVPCQSF